MRDRVWPSEYCRVWTTKTQEKLSWSSIITPKFCAVLVGVNDERTPLGWTRLAISGGLEGRRTRRVLLAGGISVTLHAVPGVYRYREPASRYTSAYRWVSGFICWTCPCSGVFWTISAYFSLFNLKLNILWTLHYNHSCLKLKKSLGPSTEIS